MAFIWTGEAVDRLKALHAQGLSGSELARAIGGGLTRSAVFGKLHRLGLTGGKSGATHYQSWRLAASGLAARGGGPMKFNFARKKVNDAAQVEITLASRRRGRRSPRRREG